MELTNMNLTEVEAAKVLGLSVATLRAWRLRRTGPRFVRLGRAVRYTANDLRLYVEHNTVDTKPETTAKVQDIGISA